MFDSIAITVDGPRAWDLDLAFDITFSDLERSFRVSLSNGVLIYVEREPDGLAQLHLTLTKPRLLALLAGDNSTDGLSEMTSRSTTLRPPELSRSVAQSAHVGAGQGTKLGGMATP